MICSPLGDKAQKNLYTDKEDEYGSSSINDKQGIH